MEFHTFVICAYGESPYLEACIRSLLSQTEKSRILCATSTPGPWLRRLLDRYQIPLHVREGEPGIAADWNFAAGLADSRFVTLAHQDDRYSRHYVEELKKAYRRWPDMTVFITDCAVVKNGRLQRPGAMELVKKLLRMPLRLAGLADRTWVKMGALRFGNPMICPSCAYRTDRLPAPPFDGRFRFVLDWDCMARLALRPGRFVCAERPLLCYRVHAGAATSACIRDHSREKEEREMFARFWPAWAADLLMRFYRLAYRQYDRTEG